MKILIVCQHYPMCLGRRLLEAFERIGVEARHIGPDMNGYAGVSQRDFAAQYGWVSMGDWQHYWEDWTPDIVLYAETLESYWHHAYYADVPHVQYNTAGPMDKPMPGVAHTFTAVSWGGIWQQTDQVSWLPCAYNSGVCKPSRIPWGERKYDVVMIGRLDDPRKRLLHELEAAGLTCFYTQGMILDDYVRQYHQGRMALVQTVQRTAPMRLFEGAALGCLLLTPWYPEYSLLDVDGVMVFNEQEPGAVVEAARFALAHPSWAIQMIEKARRWGLRHTWEDRARKIMDWWDYERQVIS